jgi:SAM-dependent methyltransferase
MASTAVKPGNTENVNSSRRMVLLTTVARKLALWKQEFAVLRDRKIYADFSSPAYQQNNISRLQHLESLGLDLAQKNVLELGAGIGDHSLFYLYRNSRVLAVEGRAKLAKKLANRLGIEVQVVDFDREPERLEEFGKFDLVHCYGLLYHLSNPERFLSSVSRVSDCLILETCVSFGGGLRLNRCREPNSVPSQALNGEGCRPTREWVFEELKRRYECVYATRTQPRHPEFPIDWSDVEVKGPLLKRAVFIASHNPICNSNLVTELPNVQPQW